MRMMGRWEPAIHAITTSSLVFGTVKAVHIDTLTWMTMHERCVLPRLQGSRRLYTALALHIYLLLMPCTSAMHVVV